MSLPLWVREKPTSGRGERHALELLHDVPQFHAVALEEFAPGGDVVEQVAHGDVGAHGTGNLPRALVLGGGHGHFHAGLLCVGAGFQANFGHGGDGSQRLSTEAEGKDVVQVFGFLQFGCGVALEAQHGVVRRHAHAVVNDLDQGAAGIHHHYLDVRGTRVYRILHQFLHHGSGALHHLSRGNHVGDIFG